MSSNSQCGQGTPRVLSLLARKTDTPVDISELQQIWHLAHAELDGEWSLELDEGEDKMQLRHAVTEEDGGRVVVDHVCVAGWLEMGLGGLCDLILNPELRRRWDKLFGENMCVLESEGDTFMSFDFPGFMAVPRRSYLSWFASRFFNADGSEAMASDQASGRAMLWRPADVLRPGLPLKDAYRDESAYIGMYAERDEEAPTSRSRLVIVIRAMNYLGSPTLTRYLASTLLRHVCSYYIRAIQAEIASSRDSHLESNFSIDLHQEPKQLETGLRWVPRSLYQRAEDVAIEAFEISQLRHLADNLETCDWDVGLDLPHMRIFHCADEDGDHVSNHACCVLELQTDFDSLCDLLDDPELRCLWDDWFGHQRQLHECPGQGELGCCLLSCESSSTASCGVGVPGLGPSRRRYLHWYGKQRYDEQGQEITGAEKEVFGEATLQRPASAADSRLTSTLREEERCKDYVALGTVAERDISDAERSRLVVVIHVVDYFGWSVVSKFLAPGLLRHSCLQLAENLANAIQAQPTKVLGRRYEGNLMRGILPLPPRSLYTASASQAVTAYEFMQLRRVASQKLEGAWSREALPALSSSAGRSGPAAQLLLGSWHLEEGSESHYCCILDLEARFEFLYQLLEHPLRLLAPDVEVVTVDGETFLQRTSSCSGAAPFFTAFFSCSDQQRLRYATQLLGQDGKELLDGEQPYSQAVILRPASLPSRPDGTSSAQSREASAVGLFLCREEPDVRTRMTVLLRLTRSGSSALQAPVHAQVMQCADTLRLEASCGCSQTLASALRTLDGRPLVPVAPPPPVQEASEADAEPAGKGEEVRIQEPAFGGGTDVQVVQVWEVQRRKTLFHSDWHAPFMLHDGDTCWRWVNEDYERHPWITVSQEESASSSVPPLTAPTGWVESCKSWCEIEGDEDGATACDEEGWQYAIDFVRHSWLWGPSGTAFHCRRRLWKCSFVKAPAAALQSQSDGGSTGAVQLDHPSFLTRCFSAMGRTLCCS